MVCNINTVLLSVLIIIIIAFTDKIFNHMPILTKIFTDSINFILLIILVILVILIDLPCGILLTFLILYLAVYIKNTYINTNEHFNNFASVNKNSQVISNNSSDMITNNLKMNKSSNIMGSSDNEIIYNNNTFTNNNIPPFNVNKIMQNIPTSNNIIPSNSNNDCNNDNKLNCKYDFKNSQHNMTIYGKPLADCNNYNKYNNCLIYPIIKD